MNPQLIAASMQAMGNAMKAGPAGPSSAYGKSESAQKGVMDGSNWSVNYGGAQLAGGGGMTWLLLAGAAALVFVWLKKR